LRLSKNCLSRMTVNQNNKTISCDEFEFRVNELLDQRTSLTEDALLSNHAEDCHSCESLLNQYAVFNDYDGLLDPIEDSGEFKLMSAPAKRNAAKRWTVVTSVAVAMLMAVVLLVATEPPMVSPTAGLNTPTGPVAMASAPELAIAAPELAAETASAAELVTPDAVYVSAQVGSVKLPGNLQLGHSLANVNLELMNWNGIEKNLESIQPVLKYSGRIPVISSVQNTVNMTLGWLRSGKSQDQAAPTAPKSEPDFSRRNSWSMPMLAGLC